MFATGPFLAIGKIGGTELIVILLIVLVVFGPQQLPKLSKMFGETIKNFKKGMEEADEEGASQSVKKTLPEEKNNSVDAD